MRPERTTFAEAIARGRPTVPEEANLAWTSWEHRTEDGLDLPVWDLPGAHGGPTLLWLHDHGRSRIDALPEADSWLAWCGRVVLVDLRGHGDAPGTCTLGQRERDDVDRLIEQLGEESLILAGRGFGAVLAIDAAERHRGVAVWAASPRSNLRLECAALLRRFRLPSWPLCALVQFSLWALGCRPIEPITMCDDERIRIVADGEPIPSGPWRSPAVTGDAPSS